MEVIGGVSAILQVISSVTKVAKRLNEVAESYENVALNTTLVASQISTIRAALEALYEWRTSDRLSTAPSRQLDKDLGMSLSCCNILIGVIDQKLNDSGYMPGLKQKIRYLWLEDILKEYISNLEGQVRALQLLLTIFQCRTETEKRQKLDHEESRTIIAQMRAETASLAMDNIDFKDDTSVLSLDPSVILDIDSILMQSPAYKRVYGNARLRLSTTDNANPVENSEATGLAPTPLPKEPLHPPPPPPRPTRKSMPQSQGRIDVWDFYPAEKEEDKIADDPIMADSNVVFELVGETQGSIATRQRDEASEEEQGFTLQYQGARTEMADREAGMTGIDSSKEVFSSEKPLVTHTVPRTLPAIAADVEPIPILDGFMTQLDLAFAEKRLSQDNERDLGLLYGPPMTPEAAASQLVSRKYSQDAGRHSKPQPEDLDFGQSLGNSLRAEDQRRISTHSSLYECSIRPESKGTSTRTSSPFSCDSCKNIDVTAPTENDKLEAETHDIFRSSPRLESGNADVHSQSSEKMMNPRLLNHIQQTLVIAGADPSDDTQVQDSKDILSLLPKSPAAEQYIPERDHVTHFTSPADITSKSELEDFEPSRSAAGLGLQNGQTSETSELHPPETRTSYSSMHSPPELAALTKSMPSVSHPAVVFLPSSPSKTPESELSTLSSNRHSSVHDATSTVSSSEAPEASTIMTLQQSTSNTAATSMSTNMPRFDRDETRSDLRRLQDELAAATARGESRAVQDSMQQSIEAVRRKYLAETSIGNKKAPLKSPSPRLGKVRSHIMRFPSLPGSAKGAALGDSAASGNTISVQKILQEKVNVDSRSDNFKTPLMRAAMNGHIECMELLRQSGADEIAVDARGRTVLHIAVANNRLAAVKWLLEAYPPPKPDLLKHRPSILLRASDVVKGGRSQKNLREASDTEGSKPLHIAAEMDKGGMVKTLLTAGVDIESKDNRGRTPFHRAIISKRRDSFDTLLRSGAKIAAVDAKSVSSLHLAAQAGQVDMIETLLANGAERWCFDADGYQPIHSAVRGRNPLAIEALVTERRDFDKRTESGETLLHLACLEKDLELAKYILTNPVDINPWAMPNPRVLQVLSHTRIKGSSMTPLHYACCLCDYETAYLLLDHEALVNAPTPEGATALMMAVETENTNLVNLLLQRDAKVNAKIPGSLVTALHLAARRGDLDTVQQLCRHHAHDNARTGDSSYGRTPMDECMKCPDKQKRQAVEQYIRTVVTNRIRNTLHANARNLQTVRSQSSQQPPYNPAGAQIAPLANPVSYAPWAGAQHGYPQNQGYIAQQAQVQNVQYYHPDFDVPDDDLPAYEAGPNAPTRLANQAPVHRERYS